MLPKSLVVEGQLGSAPDPVGELTKLRRYPDPPIVRELAHSALALSPGKNILVGQLPGLHFDPSYATDNIINVI